MEILKLFFGKRQDGVWEIQCIRGLPLEPEKGESGNLFKIKDDIFIAEPSFAGTTKSVLGQSIVPIVAQVPGENILRCLGTGFFISCSGLLITAAHVLMDPLERDYGGAREFEYQRWNYGNLKLGVMIPLNPVLEGGGFIFRDIEWSVLLAERTQQPLPIKGVDLKITSDTAVCKVAQISPDIPFQPLSVIQTGLRGTGLAAGKSATAVGYGALKDVELRSEGGRVISGEFSFDLYVSTGEILGCGDNLRLGDSQGLANQIQRWLLEASDGRRGSTGRPMGKGEAVRAGRAQGQARSAQRRATVLRCAVVDRALGWALA